LLFAAVSAELPAPGSYVVYSVGACSAIISPAYVPGPLSSAKEYNVLAFHAWYLRALGSLQATQT
jgi:hypothetical protein